MIAEIVVIAQLIYPLEIQPHLVPILSGLCVQQSFGLLGALYLRIHSLCTMMEFIWARIEPAANLFEAFHCRVEINIKCVIARFDDHL